MSFVFRKLVEAIPAIPPLLLHPNAQQ